MAPACSILVIDDDSALRGTLAQFLECEGFHVAVAGDGQGALERLERGFRPDVILADVLMPGMNGYELVHRLRRTPALGGISLVLMSAGDEDLLASTARDANASFPNVAGWLRKPFALDELLRTVLRASQASRPAAS